MAASFPSLVGASTPPSVALPNGTRFPAIGLGTFAASDDEVYTIVKEAVLTHGYRYIDTAMIYGNEAAIGKALRDCFAAGVKREELFVSTKLWHTEKGDVEGAVRRSLERLQLDYIDLYLIHWIVPDMDWNASTPVKPTPLHVVWGHLEDLVDRGLLKNIGVSNCTIPQLLDLLAYARLKPAVNQIELHPYLVQPRLVELHNRLGVRVQAYSPLGSPGAAQYRGEGVKDLNLLKEPLLAELAQKYQKSIGQIVLNWHLHRGHMIIPKTVKSSRLAENLKCYDFALTPEEYTAISALDQGVHFWDPAFMDEFGFGSIPYFS